MKHSFKSPSLLIGTAIIASLLTMPMNVSALDSQLDETYYGQLKGQNISLNVYNWGEYISDGSDDSLDVNSEFEALTGIKVNYSTFATNEELYAKLQSGAVSYDIIIPSDYMIARMIRENMVQKLDKSLIPSYSNIDPQYLGNAYDPTDEYSVPYTWGTVGIIYNTTRVTEEVTSWDILWNENYAGDILMFSNPRDALMIAEKKLGYSLNTTDEQEIKTAFLELKNQKPLIQAYVMDEIFDKMGSGEAAIAPYYAGDALVMMETNPDLAFCSPEEGTNVFIDSICIPSDATNVLAAHMYINFLCEAEVAAANIEYIGYSSPNHAAMELLDEEVRTNPVAYPPQKILDNCETYLVLPNETNAMVDTQWTKLLSTSAEADAAVKSGDDSVLVPLFAIIAVCGVAYGLYQKRKARQALLWRDIDEDEDDDEE